jgi:16S rRNA (uracil1498-N3)-methyltransferase
MQLFYQANIALNTTHILDQEESRHCAQVLRLKPGDALHLTNGIGSHFIAELIQVHHKKCIINVHTQNFYPKSTNYSLHVAVAPTKNIDRLEWFIEKAVELGIDQITPIICSHSERKEVKTERLSKVAIAAVKQSLKFYLPQINDTISFNEFVNKTEINNAFICFGDANSSNNLHEYNTKNKHNLFLIGPEGDFSPKEIELASQKGFIPLNLGKARLRTETAAIHIVSISNFQNMK